MPPSPVQRALAGLGRRRNANEEAPP